MLNFAVVQRILTLENTEKKKIISFDMAQWSGMTYMEDTQSVFINVQGQIHDITCTLGEFNKIRELIGVG